MHLRQEISLLHVNEYMEVHLFSKYLLLFVDVIEVRNKKILKHAEWKRFKKNTRSFIIIGSQRHIIQYDLKDRL